ncbi:Palmitoyltransferase [Cladochytrium tenue]|nr:Palmitoyltransferase [Cladochytrium tenue]
MPAATSARRPLLDFSDDPAPIGHAASSQPSLEADEAAMSTSAGCPRHHHTTNGRTASSMWSRCDWTKWGSRAAVVLVLFLISFIPFTSQYYIFYGWLSYTSFTHAVVWLAPFDLAVLSIWVNYALACLTDPGRVPAGFGVPSTEPGQKQPQQQDAPLLGGARGAARPALRFCGKCKSYKPPRSHHCSTCGRCVLKMDHHYIELIYMIINVILFLMVLFLVGILTVWQSYYVCTNATTIESMENSKIEELFERGRIRHNPVYPYDLGMWRNLGELLGYPFFLWLFPLPPRGDGLSFPVNDEAVAEARSAGGAVRWPPPEYVRHRARYGDSDSDGSEWDETGEDDDEYDDDCDGDLVAEESEDGEDEEMSAAEAGSDRGARVFAAGRRTRVRRGSEGYIVRPPTVADRERMVREASGGGRGGGAYDETSDNEILAEKQERYRSQGLVVDHATEVAELNAEYGGEEDTLKALCALAGLLTSSAMARGRGTGGKAVVTGLLRRQRAVSRPGSQAPAKRSRHASDLAQPEEVASDVDAPAALTVGSHDRAARSAAPAAHPPHTTSRHFPTSLAASSPRSPPAPPRRVVTAPAALPSHTADDPDATLASRARAVFREQLPDLVLRAGAVLAGATVSTKPASTNAADATSPPPPPLYTLPGHDAYGPPRPNVRTGAAVGVIELPGFAEYGEACSSYAAGTQLTLWMHARLTEFATRAAAAEFDAEAAAHATAQAAETAVSALTESPDAARRGVLNDRQSQTPRSHSEQRSSAGSGGAVEEDTSQVVPPTPTAYAKSAPRGLESKLTDDGGTGEYDASQVPPTPPRPHGLASSALAVRASGAEDVATAAAGGSKFATPREFTSDNVIEIDDEDDMVSSTAAPAHSATIQLLPDRPAEASPPPPATLPQQKTAFRSGLPPVTFSEPPPRGQPSAAIVATPRPAAPPFRPTAMASTPAAVTVPPTTIASVSTPAYLAAAASDPGSVPILEPSIPRRSSEAAMAASAADTHGAQALWPPRPSGAPTQTLLPHSAGQIPPATKPLAASSLAPPTTSGPGPAAPAPPPAPLLPLNPAHAAPATSGFSRATQQPPRPPPHLTFPDQSAALVVSHSLAPPPSRPSPLSRQIPSGGGTASSVARPVAFSRPPAAVAAPATPPAHYPRTPVFRSGPAAAAGVAGRPGLARPLVPPLQQQAAAARPNGAGGGAAGVEAGRPHGQVRHLWRPGGGGGDTV